MWPQRWDILSTRLDIGDFIGSCVSLEWFRLHTHPRSPKPREGVARYFFLKLKMDDRAQEVMRGRHCEFGSVMEEQDGKPQG